MQKKNKLGVKNGLYANMNARKKKGIPRSKSKSTVSDSAYKRMKNDFGRKNKQSKAKK